MFIVEMGVGVSLLVYILGGRSREFAAGVYPAGRSRGFAAAVYSGGQG